MMALAFGKLSIMVVAVFVVLGALDTGLAKAGDCRKEKEELVAACGKYCLKEKPLPFPPSAKCCSKIKAADFACLCQNVTPGDEEIFNMKLGVTLARKCGNPLPVGMKCGSYFVPEA
ncbi:uncharacterized protein LOC116267243 isoform X2 [Nymphaea colorata]|nr:uncharacterized protein LOC116267243 isoform X1 [Nymphaea colorata]XP_049937226.1 uncharacterized protein LOC116267243 isoform X2 [Nymphaea colorata]